MTASDIERLETLQLLTETQMRRLREALFWLKRRQRTIPVANCEDSLDALAAVAVEQAEKLRRLQNRDADAALLAVANARGTCGECYYNRKCSIQDAARAGDAFYCAAFEQKDEGPYDAPVSSDFLP